MHAIHTVVRGSDRAWGPRGCARQTLVGASGIPDGYCARPRPAGLYSVADCNLRVFLQTTVVRTTAQGVFEPARRSGRGNLEIKHAAGRTWTDDHRDLPGYARGSHPDAAAGDAGAF